ncbi:DUF1697 domain-containing protein [Sphingomonas crusticola]|uniref:DUF1697 domain-containing protein n=1 Tax=Sphingomonas crusticola TaxID=1697973 RepID=UPI000E2265F7|nr:DUF1697 domain-containing protein [Sphingomonas crusticola]
MTAYVALLRAVNVGGTGKLPMTELKAMCEAAGLAQVRTYIASGNVVFTSDKSEAAVRASIEAPLEAYAGKRVGVLVRTAAEMAETLAHNPFADKPGNRTVALFVDQPIPGDALASAKNVKDEEMRLGKRAIYIFYGDGMADSRLAIPAAKTGTARNMNTIAKLAEMAAALG